MKIAENIALQIKKIPEDRVFGYVDLKIADNQFLSAAKAIERLQKNGVIKKLSKGKFYKPKKTAFGILKPNQEEFLKSYLFDNNKRVAYITGNYLFNQLGLTTQVGKQLQIASRSKRIIVKTDLVNATPVISYVDVTDDNYILLGILDAIKELKTIQDVELKSAILIIAERINKMDEKNSASLIRYALKYPPRVRALLGSILDQINSKSDFSKLKSSLNPITVYKIGIDASILKSVKFWNIQ
jgi:hypothetical protein